MGHEWVIWEHYDPAPGAPYKKQSQAASWSMMQKVAWFNDIVTFWRLWSTLPFSKLEKYFVASQSVPVYVVGTEKKRISTLSVFQSGIEPKWEDDINKNGSEFRFTLNLIPEKQSYSGFLNQLWEDFVLDLISKRTPHTSDIAGIRIADKTRGDQQVIRIEVWMKFHNADTDPRGVAIKNFILEEYLKKHDLPSGADVLKFENHVAHH